MPPSPSLRAQLLALADLLPPLGNASDPLTIIVRRGAARLRFEFAPAELAGQGHTDLSAIEQAVLRAATKTPQTVKALARAAKHCYGRTSEAVSRLTSLEPPLLIKVRGGVRLP